MIDDTRGREIRDAYKVRERPPRGHSRRCGADVDYWTNDVIRDPGDYEGRHRREQ